MERRAIENTSKRERGIPMDPDVNEMKYAICPSDNSTAVLLVDIETETAPDTDEDHNLQYYCMEGHHVFSVSEDEDDDIDSQ
jgi:hypothetical protein